MTRRRALLLVLAAAWLPACAPNMAPVYTRGESYTRGGPTAVSSSGYYVVRPGDTLYSISWRHGLDFRAVARWNRIDPPYTIRPGQRLRLSAGSAAVASRSPAPQSRPKQTPPRRPPTPAPSTPETSTISWRWPTDGKLVKSFTAAAQGKQGIELRGTLGQPINAAGAGRVVYAGSGLRGYGNLVIVKHNARYLTAYGYNQEILVKEGDMVRAGQQIGTMGLGSGQQPALHFELRRDGKPVDPVRYLPSR